MKNNEVPAIPFPASAVFWLHVGEQSEILLHREFEKITDENIRTFSFKREHTSG
jgi:hypothetical protein